MKNLNRIQVLLSYAIPSKIYLLIQQTTKAFLPGMIKDGSGHIVTISSAAGLFGVPRLSAYCGTKFAAVGFHESIANEVKVRLILSNLLEK